PPSCMATQVAGHRRAAAEPTGTSGRSPCQPQSPARAAARDLAIPADASGRVGGFLRAQQGSPPPEQWRRSPGERSGGERRPAPAVVGGTSVPAHKRRTRERPGSRTTSGARAGHRAPKVGFVSLGCPKALVDSERILTQLRAEGYEVAPTYEAADLVVVNTCGFIDAAIDESLDAIGEALSRCGRVIVTGCLGARPERILERHPRVLKVTGPQAYEEVVGAVHEQLPPRHDPFLDLVPPQGVRLTPRHYAYLKVAEGCNNKCSFCIIPAMR